MDVEAGRRRDVRASTAATSKSKPAGETDVGSRFRFPPVAFEASAPAAPESQPVYSAETASETLAGAPSAGIKTTRDGSSSASGKVGGAGGGESARGARAREGRRRGRDRRSARTVVGVVVVVVGGGGDVFVVERRGVRVGGSGAGDEVPRRAIWAARASSRAMDSAAARSNAASAAASSRSRAARGTAASDDGIDARERRGRRRVAAEASVKSGISASLDPSLSSSLASMVGIASLRPQEERLAVATDGVAHHREPEGGAVGSRPSLQARPGE